MDLKKFIEKLEQQYQEEKNKECEELHNAIADIIAEKKATVQNVLFVLKMIEFELLKAKYEQLMGSAIVPPGGGVKREGPLTTETAK